MKKWINIVLIFTCLVLPVLFVGCKAQTKGIGEPINFTGYPMDAEGWTVSWWVGFGFIPNNVYANANESPFHQWLQEHLGVKIDWRIPIRGSESDEFPLILASGDFPDLMYGPMMRDAERLIDEGVLRDLTPYIEKWSPNFWAWIQSNPEYDRAVKTDSGRYYCYPIFREAGGWNGTYLGPVINKTWLDETGLPMPVTLSDWDKTIRVFNERYGAVFSFAINQMAWYATGISGAFGAYAFTDYRLYRDKNDRMQLANIQPEYREMLMQFNRWWEDGLLDQNFFNTNDIIARSNALNLRKGISFTSMGNLTNWRMDAENQNTGANWIGLQYPTGDDGTLVQVSGGFGVFSTAAFITTAVCDEKLELAMRILDYGYSPEGHLFWNFGKKGVSWDFDEHGNPAFLPLVLDDPNGRNDAVSKYTGTSWSGPAVQATAMITLKNSPEAVAANDLWFYPNEPITSADKMPVGLTFTEEESVRLRELGTVQTYVNESVLLFVIGRLGFENWETYVERANALGAQEIISIYQAAYDRYLAR